MKETPAQTTFHTLAMSRRLASAHPGGRRIKEEFDTVEELHAAMKKAQEGSND